MHIAYHVNILTSYCCPYRYNRFQSYLCLAGSSDYTGCNYHTVRYQCRWRDICRFNDSTDHTSNQ